MSNFPETWKFTFLIFWNAPECWSDRPEHDTTDHVPCKASAATPAAPANLSKSVRINQFKTW